MPDDDKKRPQIKRTDTKYDLMPPRDAKKPSASAKPTPVAPRKRGDNQQTQYVEIPISRTTSDDNTASTQTMLEQINNYGNTDQPDLYSSVLKKARRSNTTARKKFINYINDNRATLPNYNSYDYLKTTNPQKASVKLADFLGEKGARLYRRALEEERHSKEYFKAVLHASTKHYDGTKWKKPPVIIVGGPSASGKSVATDAAVNEANMFLEKDDSNNNGNDVISIDGGIIREVSQMRKLVIRLANEKGYTGITDLHQQSYVLEAVKDDVLEAAFKTIGVGIAIPDTFSDFINYINPFNNRISKLLNKIKESDGERTTIFTRVVGKNSKTFPKAVAFVGNLRAWQTTDTATSPSAEEFDLNSTKNLPESKAYGANGFRLGQFGSWITERWFKRNFPHNIRMTITNDLVLKKEKDGAAGQWEDATEITDGVICVSESFFQLWENLMKYNEGLEGDLDNPRNISNVDINEFYENIKNYNFHLGSALNPILKSATGDKVPQKIIDLLDFLQDGEKDWTDLKQFSGFMRDIVPPSMQTAGQNQLLRAIDLISERIINIENSDANKTDRTNRIAKLKKIKSMLLVVSRNNASRDEINERILPSVNQALTNGKKYGKTKVALEAAEKALNTIMNELPNTQPTVIRQMLDTVSRTFGFHDEVGQQANQSSERRPLLSDDTFVSGASSEDSESDLSSSEIDSDLSNPLSEDETSKSSTDSSSSETDSGSVHVTKKPQRQQYHDNSTNQNRRIVMSSDSDASNSKGVANENMTPPAIEEYHSPVSDERDTPSSYSDESDTSMLSSSLDTSSDDDSDDRSSLASTAPLIAKENPMDLTQVNKKFRRLQEVNPKALLDRETAYTLHRLQRTNIHDWLSPAFGAKARDDAQRLQRAFNRLETVDDIVALLEDEQGKLEVLQGDMIDRLAKSGNNPTRFYNRLYKEVAEELEDVKDVLDIYKKIQEHKDNLKPIIDATKNAEEHRIIGFSKSSTVHVKIRDKNSDLSTKPIKEKQEPTKIAPAEMDSNSKETAEQPWHEADAPLQDDKIRVFDVTYNEKRENIYGKFQGRFTEELSARDASTRVNSKNPAVKLTVAQFPESVGRASQKAETAAKLDYAMLMASQMLANLNTPPDKNHPIVLRGGNEEQLKYLWTALMVLGDKTPHMKFNSDAIVVRSVYFDPKKEKGIITRFARNSLYNDVFKQHENHYQKIIDGVAKMTKAKLGHEPNLARADKALNRLFTQNAFKKTLGDIRPDSSKSSSSKTPGSN